jgi:hypothetical protein
VARTRLQVPEFDQLCGDCQRRNAPLEADNNAVTTDSQRLLDRSESPETAGRRAMDLNRAIAAVRPGTILMREWNGQMHGVAVLADGFAWNGKTYPKPVAGRSRDYRHGWNGPRFFGLRDKSLPRSMRKCARCRIENGAFADLDGEIVVVDGRAYFLWARSTNSS